MPKKYRKNIPKAVKDRLWDITFGPEAGQGECHVCQAIINSKRFEAGHIASVFNGGKDTIDNLECICSTCNKSMGTENMEVFKKRYFSGKIKKQKYHFRPRKEPECQDEEQPDLSIQNITEEPEPDNEILYKKINELDKFYFRP